LGGVRREIGGGGSDEGCGSCGGRERDAGEEKDSSESDSDDESPYDAIRASIVVSLLFAPPLSVSTLHKAMSFRFSDCFSLSFPLTTFKTSGPKKLQ